MDNRIFNVNGSGDEMLLLALNLAFIQEGSDLCKSWSQSKEHGLILSWHKEEGFTPFPSGLTPEQVLPIVKEWIISDFAKNVELSEWCNDQYHDGSNSEGFQVYCESWGHVGPSRQAICAIKPAFMWHGK